MRDMPLNQIKTQKVMYVDDVSHVNLVTKTFLLYNNNCENNILFIGGCRMTQFAFYFNNINIPHLKRNIYMIYVPDWNGKFDIIPKNTIKKIVDNTDLFICESVQKYDILNTISHLDVNFFKEFGITNKPIFMLPNLELRMYHHTIMHIIKKPIHEVHSKFLHSMKYLCEHIDSLGYKPVSDFIQRNISKIKLFNTHSHPRRFLMLLLFKHMMLKADISLNLEFYNEMNKYSFIEGHETPVCQKDVDLYNIKYNCIISDNTVLEDPNAYINHIHPIEPYEFVETDEFIIF